VATFFEGHSRNDFCLNRFATARFAFSQSKPAPLSSSPTGKFSAIFSRNLWSDFSAQQQFGSSIRTIRREFAASLIWWKTGFGSAA